MTYRSVILAATLSVAWASHPALAQHDTAQLLEEQKRGRDLESAPTPEKPQPLAPAVEADTTGIWYHLHRHDPNAAQAEMERLKAENPGWSPPGDVLAALRSERIRTALAAGNNQEARRLAAGLGSFDRCTQPDLGWAVAEAEGGDALLNMARTCPPGVAAASMQRYLRTKPEDAAALARRNWPEPVRRVLEDHLISAQLAQLNAGLLPPERLGEVENRVDDVRSGGAATALGWHHLNAHAPAKARTWFAKALNWGADGSAREGLGRALIALGEFDQARIMAQKSPALAPILADALVGQAMAQADGGAPLDAITGNLRMAAQFGRGDGWEAVGWRLIERGRPQDAAAIFAQAGPGEPAAYGRMIAERSAGNRDAAEALACDQRTLSARFQQACADALAERQLAAYDGGDFPEAQRLGERLGEVAPEHRGGRTLLAWSALRNGDAGQAAQIFTQLYDEQADPALAGGLVESLQAAGKDDALAARIAAGDRLLGDTIATQQATIAWGRKQFDLAARAPSPRPELAGRSDWQVGSGVEMRSTNGQHGQSQFDILAPRLFTEGMVGDVRLNLTLVGARLGTGTAAPGTSIGRRPAGSETSTPLDDTDVVVPIVSLRWEAPDWTVAGHLSTTPLDGPITARPTGEVAVTHHGDPVILGGRLFAQSVGGSMLSYAGLRDPVTGDHWGRVVDQGVAAQAIYLPLERVSLALSGEAARLTGHEVEDNNRIALRTDAAYDFRPAGFDHLRIGPFVSYAHFDRNLSHFTYGHGGYYSPDSDLREGMLLDAMTEEGRQWQVEFKSSLAFSHADEDTAYSFPLDKSGSTYGASATDGINTDLSLRASALLTKQLILSAFGRYSAAPRYTDIAFGAFLTVPFTPRAGVFSTDLPDGVFSPFR